MEGITVGELKKQLEKFKDSGEVAIIARQDRLDIGWGDFDEFDNISVNMDNTPHIGNTGIERNVLHTCRLVIN